MAAVGSHLRSLSAHPCQDGRHRASLARIEELL